MAALLEVIALHSDDAERAEQGGADRVELLSTISEGGLSPEPRMVEKVRRHTSIQIRPMVRLRGGFGTDGGEFTRLKGLISSYRDEGADGLVFGFLNGEGMPDRQVICQLVEDTDLPWTFHRAIDYTLETDRAWRVLHELPGLDQVLTAGSTRGVEYGLDDLVTRSRRDPRAAQLIMAGGGLKPEHVPWLIRAGVRAFHIGSAARPLGSYKAYVDSDLVRTWRDLLDTEISHYKLP